MVLELEEDPAAPTPCLTQSFRLYDYNAYIYIYFYLFPRSSKAEASFPSTSSFSGNKTFPNSRPEVSRSAPSHGRGRFSAKPLLSKSQADPKVLLGCCVVRPTCALSFGEVFFGPHPARLLEALPALCQNGLAGVLFRAVVGAVRERGQLQHCRP